MVIDLHVGEEDIEVHEGVAAIAPMGDIVQDAVEVFFGGSNLDVDYLELWGRRDLDDCSEALASMENGNGLVDFVESFKLMGDVLLDRPFAQSRLIYQLGHVINALPASKGRA